MMEGMRRIADSLPEDIMGWLWMKTGFGKKKRYFRFRNGILSKHMSEGGAAWWSLNVATSKLQLYEAKRMLVVSCKWEEVFLYADTEEKVMTWYYTLRKYQMNTVASVDSTGITKFGGRRHEGIFQRVKAPKQLNRKPFEQNVTAILETSSVSDSSTSIGGSNYNSFGSNYNSVSSNYNSFGSSYNSVGSAYNSFGSGSNYNSYNSGLVVQADDWRSR
uniref:PH domain-containing protein n=1 Tax=Rhodosorus marinus TaxID=101924 RepID=A0A7S0G3B0_9RHOD|mmetsp:Transcript_1947/g.2949  ORF Transcript_1947/g.2949 Transcript_1947/m.2949 type:complete len:218 (+) Transcript_1947:142-795(+)